MNTSKIDRNFGNRRCQELNIVPDLIVSARVVDGIRRRCRKHRTDALDVFTDAGNGVRNVEPMPVYVPIARCCAYAENEPPTCVFSQRQCAQCRQDRRPGHLRDASADPCSFYCARHSSEWDEGVTNASVDQIISAQPELKKSESPSNPCQ